MSSRIIRGDDRLKKARVTGASAGAAEVPGPDHAVSVEKQAFEQGYKEGERVGKQMGERMVATAGQRYDRSVQELVQAHKALRETMEKEAVRLALAVARKIVQREVAMDPDLIVALVSVALKRVQGQSSVTVRLSSQDFPRLEPALRAVGASMGVKEDPTLERGDFILDSLQTHVDGRVAGQIESIGRVLLDE